MSDSINTEELVNLALQAGKPLDINGVPAILIPDNAELKTLEHLQELDAPRRTRRDVKVRTDTDFVAYFNRYCNSESTVYADVDRAMFVGHIDHYSKEQTSHLDHTVTYSCPETPEWKQWKESNKKWMSQTEFAEFLQENHLQIHKPDDGQFTPEEFDVVMDKLPDPARMLEIANTLTVRSKSAITSSQNLSNGSLRIDYTDEVEGKAGANGQYEIPTYFVLGIQPFKGGKGYMILCRLKFRKNGPNATLCYELVRPHKAHEKAVQDVLDRILNGARDEKGELIENTGIAAKNLYEVI